jgi:anthranilate phosphoribosyltransferase
VKETLERLIGGTHLAEDEASDLLLGLTDGAVPQAMAGAVLAALRAKGETAEEVRGFSTAMRGLARRPALTNGRKPVDVVGTGGDGSHSLNLSTGAALLAAACGVPVVKHGNRSVSSRCGSADVLEALGVPMQLDEEAAGACYERTGFTFLFAPYYHPAMAALAPVRRALGVRTVFNLLGPLTNPASPPFGVFGAFSTRAAELLADALAGLPIERAFVVHGACGWDEATPVGAFLLLDVRPGRVTRTVRDPGDLGIPRCGPGDLAGADAAENARRLEAVFDGERGPHRDALVLGAALALEVTGEAGAADGVARAAQALDSGAGKRLLGSLREVSHA